MSNLKKWLGLEKRSEFIDKYFTTANYRSSIYMSVVIIVLELWMLLSLLHRWITAPDSKTVAWFIEHLLWYLVLIINALFMIFFALRYLQRKEQGNGLLGKLTMVVFSVIFLIFGMGISLSDYTKGEQILCFAMALVFVFGILNWRPWVMLLFESMAFIVFYILMYNSSLPVTYATKVNYFIYFIAMVMLGISVYNQRLSEAEKEEELSIISVRDELTGIANMNYFRTEAIERMHSGKVSEMLFLFIDITNFRAYNEKHGFDAGSMFIKETANDLLQCLPGDLVARDSDDHFVALTYRTRIHEKVEKIAHCICDKHHSTQIGVKIGAYAPLNPECDPSYAVDHARYACNSIKKRFDRNFYEYDENMDLQYKRRRYVINHVREAIDNGYIKVYYQPVVLAKDRSVCGLEALARWIDPTYGFISPGDFIPALEEYRLIHLLDRKILETVCKDIREAIDEGLPPIPASVNFSRLDFEASDMSTELECLLEKYNLDHDFIHVEITESALNDNQDKFRMAVHSIKSNGMQLWLDDFGSGYSSLNVLKDFDFDVMKLDMRFLENFSDNNKSHDILYSLVKLADSIGMDTVSEGVETEEQAEFLTGIGCKRLQGYLFGRPMPVEDLKKTLPHSA
ncbi:MAG: EAL domain-containing protein [Lachnospiraceae bacterium]|nr:EAL domain-containing protein [Lachnospiraceae bacterium]